MPSAVSRESLAASVDFVLTAQAQQRNRQRREITLRPRSVVQLWQENVDEATRQSKKPQAQPRARLVDDLHSRTLELEDWRLTSDHLKTVLADKIQARVSASWSDLIDSIMSDEE